MSAARLDSLGMWDALADLPAEVGARVEMLLADDSPARSLGRRIGRTMPIVYGGGWLGRSAAESWKASCNLRAKVPAFANEIGAVSHDELSGWGQHGDVTRQVFTLVLLRHDAETAADLVAFDAVVEMCDEVVADVHTVRAQGRSSSSQLVDLVLFGEVVALELAAVAGVDPGPVPALDRFRPA